MNRFVRGEERMQQTLLPNCLEDYVADENPVRAIEVFVEELDLAALGFEGMTKPAGGGNLADWTLKNGDCHGRERDRQSCSLRVFAGA